MKELYVSRLRCEYLVNPLGIDECRPRLSWQLDSSRRGARQTAYRIQVAGTLTALKSGQTGFWDSGKVVSGDSTQIEYAGIPLVSRDQCYWWVEVTDETGVVTRSEPALWTMGLLQPSEWSARWIAANPEIIARDPAAFASSLTVPGTPGLFRREFNLTHSVSRATVYASARGLFELRMNGHRIGEDIFAPEWTDYRTRIQYRTYDVTELINKGPNCIAAVLGDGWWSGFVGWQEQRGRYGSLENSLLVQLEIEFPDGSKMHVCTDEGWVCDTGPILSSDLIMGEVYDARRERPDWDTPECEDTSRWLPVLEVQSPTATLVAQPSEPVRVNEKLTPVSITEIRSGAYIFDLGQNISGWARIRLPTLPAGTRIVMRYGERLNTNGTLYTANLRRAKATDVYIARGGEPETWQPHFTFHGFQYIEISGLPAHIKPGLRMVTGHAVYSSISQCGWFECSHHNVNRLWLNTLWSQRGNFISVPTDCPQRDERLGWTGDAQVFLRTASCNMDVAAFFTKWMVDVEDAQTADGIFPDTAPRLPEDINFVGLDGLGGAAGWADAGIIIPYTLWRVYGDRRILKRHYKAMVRWVEWIDRNNPEGLRVNQLGNNYGDWLCIPGDTSFRTHSPMKYLLATAYWADDCAKLCRIAGELGYDKDAARFGEMFEKVSQAFRKEWLLDDGQLRVETQTAYLLTLAFDLFPRELRAKATERLVENIRQKDWHLSTGFIGVGHLNPQLTLGGHADVAYKLLLRDDYPSWLYPVKRGATTVWERWNGWTETEGFFDPHMNSFNHYSLGSVGEWLFRHVAGIELDPDVPGFKRFILCPFVGEGLDYAWASLRTMYGDIESHWRKVGDRRTWDIRIPVNASAAVGIPSGNPEKILLDGVSLADHQLFAAVEIRDGRCWLALGSGSYKFVCI